MKNLLILLALTTLLGCSKDSTEPNLMTVFQIVEEYKPGCEKEIIPTKSGIALEKIDSTFIIEGDILLSQEQALSLDLPETKGSILSDSQYSWPSGIIYYYFHGDPGKTYRVASKTFTQKSIAKAAMNYYHQTTGVQFYPVTLKMVGRNTYIQQTEYIEFINGEGSWSYLGRQGSNQELCLDPTWATTGTAIHELGHAIGLLHEQCRSDRDNHININYNNIQSDKKHNFDTSNKNHNKTNFDFNSIMIYASYNSFAINSNIPTMTKKDGSTWNAQRSYLSNDDIEVIKTKYPNHPSYRVIP